MILEISAGKTLRLPASQLAREQRGPLWPEYEEGSVSVLDLTTERRYTSTIIYIVLYYYSNNLNHRYNKKNQRSHEKSSNSGMDGRSAFPFIYVNTWYGIISVWTIVNTFSIMQIGTICTNVTSFIVRTLFTKFTAVLAFYSCEIIYRYISYFIFS